MNVQFLIAGALALLASSIHGIAGEKLLVMKLRHESLPTSRFGGTSMTLMMIRGTWHVTTLAFLVIGSALFVCTPATSSEACVGVGRVSAIAFASFFMLTIGLGARDFLRNIRRHQAPIAFALIAVLSWWGAGR